MGKLKHEQVCIVCTESFLASQTGTKYCSNACRQKLYRDRCNGKVQELRNSVDELRNTDEKLRNINEALRNDIVQAKEDVTVLKRKFKTVADWYREHPGQILKISRGKGGAIVAEGEPLKGGWIVKRITKK